VQKVRGPWREGGLGFKMKWGEHGLMNDSLKVFRTRDPGPAQKA